MQKKNSQDLYQSIDKFRNYSKESGNLYRKIENKKLTLRKKDRFYCPSCKTKNDLNSIYCKSCGCNLESVVERKDSLSLDYFKSNIDFKHCFKVAIASSIILFFISFILKIFVNLSANNILFEQIKATDIMLLLNGGLLRGMASMGMSFGFGYDSGYEFYLQFNYILLVLIPMLTTALVYKLLSRNRENIMSDALGVGISYGVILAIVAVLSGNSFSFGDGFISSYSISYGIRVASVLFRGALLGFLAVALFNINRFRENSIAAVLKQAVKAIGICYLIVFIILLIGSLININYVGELGFSRLNLNIFMVFIQLAAYLLSFANCIPLSISGRNISLLNIFSSYLSIELELILVALIFISALVLFVIGTKLNSIAKNEDGKKIVLLFSAGYSLIMGAISLFTSINMDLSNLYGSSIQIGSNFILAIVISFIYSFVVAYAGFRLNIWDEQED